MPARILLVHGYSVQRLNAYGQIPALLAQSGFQTQNVYLSAYVSLDDKVTCDDLADALQSHVVMAGITDDILPQTAIICHSTGAIVTRRWILNRLKAGKTLPSHLITLAGANHGSSLAQVGRTAIARVFRGLAEQAQPGEGVLADLDYGSTFLWKLNREWLESWNRGDLTSIYCFAMGGDKHWVETIPLAIPGWQFLEPGSDSIVRVGGANLNYSFVVANVDTWKLTSTHLDPPAAHLVIDGYTHGDILGGIKGSTDRAYQALLKALSVENKGDYDALRRTWKTATDAWSAAQPSEANSTIVFRLRDGAGRPINDSWILLQDQRGDARTVSGSLCRHQPIQNEVEHSVVSFYVLYNTFKNFHPHAVQIELKSGSPSIAYQTVQYKLTSTDEQLVQPNEFTYVEVTIPRDVAKTYAIVRYDPHRDVNVPWPPFPS
jgi:hypothetical protein